MEEKLLVERMVVVSREGRAAWGARAGRDVVILATVGERSILDFSEETLQLRAFR